MRVVWIVVGMLLCASIASADTAAAHYKQGKAFFDAKQYDQAVAEYQAAYAIDKLPAHLYNVARAYHLAVNLKLALEYYQKYLEADPKSSRAAEVRGLVVDATQQLADAENKRKLDDAAKAKALADQQAKAEQERKRTTAESHVKLADAYGRAGEWARKGDELRAAAADDDDPVHLRDAGEAYAKQPDHAKARDAYLAYLDKLPRASDSDAIRDKIATETRALEEEAKQAAKAKQVAALPTGPGRPLYYLPPDLPPRPPAWARGWSGFGVKVAAGGAIGTRNPFKPVGSQSEGLVPGAALDLGVYRRFTVIEQLDIRPQIGAVYRTVGFDGAMGMAGAGKLKRSGPSITLPLIFAFNRGLVSFQIELGATLAILVNNDVEVMDPPSLGNFNGLPSNKLNTDIVGGIFMDLGKATIQIEYHRDLSDAASDFKTSIQSLQFGVAIRLTKR